MTTRQEISDWFDNGVRGHASHMLVVCDTFDWEDYPVYVHKSANAKDVWIKTHDKNMQKVMEVYNLSLPKKEQLDQERTMNF